MTTGSMTNAASKPPFAISTTNMAFAVNPTSVDLLPDGTEDSSAPIAQPGEPLMLFVVLAASRALMIAVEQF